LNKCNVAVLHGSLPPNFEPVDRRRSRAETSLGPGGTSSCYAASASANAAPTSGPAHESAIGRAVTRRGRFHSAIQASCSSVDGRGSVAYSPYPRSGDHAVAPMTGLRGPGDADKNAGDRSSRWGYGAAVSRGRGSYGVGSGLSRGALRSRAGHTEHVRGKALWWPVAPRTSNKPSL
jgi:hypothetical protein